VKENFNSDICVQQLREVGVTSEDLVLVHSEVGPVPLAQVLAFFSGIQKAVSPNGTVVFPNFNFDFCKGVPFNYKTTPSHMGLLTELARRDSQAKRIYHPVYSFSLFGARAQELSQIKNISAYAEDSFFGELRRSRGKILLLNIPFQRSMTFFHHMEEVLGCDYRYMKDFTGEIIDQNGKSSVKTYKIYVRDLDRGVVTSLEPIEKRLGDSGVVKKGQVGPWPVKLMDAQEVFNVTKDILKEEPHILMRFENKN
jgi:aminoglycoside 3-N-acetyltransferase